MEIGERSTETRLSRNLFGLVLSSDTIQFNYNRAKLAQKTPDGAKDMMKTAPQHWCRANFRLGSYCDFVENYLCESFNNSIMRAIFYPVITSMEIMRRKVMARIA
jgi:hypothetical protein